MLLDTFTVIPLALSKIQKEPTNSQIFPEEISNSTRSSVFLEIADGRTVHD